MLKCSRCKVWKKESEFHKNRAAKTGYHNWCKDCNTKTNKQRYDSGKSRDSQRLRMYGVTPEDINRLLLEQMGLCANVRCGRVLTLGRGRNGLTVDHDPITKKVRGLLCRSCNTALGQLDDNPEKIRGLLEYMLNYNDNDISSMSLCIWREARGEGQNGMLAVANVIKNRANAWETKVSSPLHNVIYQKDQFSSMSVSTDPEYTLMPKDGDPQYAYAISICVPVLTGQLPDNTNGALYYGYLAACTSGWFSANISGPDGKGTEAHPLVATIGRQSFYK
jgi:hypothetical protein